MRKFAKSIGSEGKSCRNRAGKCRLETGVLFGLCGVSASRTLLASDLLARRLPFREVGIPHFSRNTVLGVRLQAKNCQLGTAYGGESNCIIKT